MEKNIQTVVFSVLVILVLLAGTGFASTEAVDWGPDGWRLLGGTVACTLATLYTLSRMGGWRSALRFMVSTLAISWLAEVIGLRGNWLFGGVYRYHGDVQPVLPGGVPLFIPLAWFVLAGIPVMLLRGVKTMRPDRTRDVRRLLWKSALGALGMVACDLALDPVAVSHGLWTWQPPGAYFGVPWLNFAGWWWVSFIVFLVGYGWTDLDRATPDFFSIRYDLSWAVAYLLLLVLLGCAVNRRTGCGTPLLLALTMLCPLSLHWISEVHWKIQTCRTMPMPT